MSFEDKTIKCADCGTDFTFTASEQQFFAEKGFTNEPKRCPACRRNRRQQRTGQTQSAQRDW
ncbi:MAG: zinc-ribbon domain-containing protein [Dehalococcoidia bacterium]|nr:zinc-ribbon domain-containing protein [Dehalococcoidia bacterium]